MLQVYFRTRGKHPEKHGSRLINIDKLIKETMVQVSLDMRRLLLLIRNDTVT